MLSTSVLNYDLSNGIRSYFGNHTKLCYSGRFLGNGKLHLVVHLIGINVKMSADTESGGNIANICTSQSYIGYIQYIAHVSVKIESELYKLAFIVDILIQKKLVGMILSVVIESDGKLSVFIVITGLVNVKIYADALVATGCPCCKHKYVFLVCINVKVVISKVGVIIRGNGDPYPLINKLAGYVVQSLDSFNIDRFLVFNFKDSGNKILELKKPFVIIISQTIYIHVCIFNRIRSVMYAAILHFNVDVHGIFNIAASSGILDIRHQLIVSCASGIAHSHILIGHIKAVSVSACKICLNAVSQGIVKINKVSMLTLRRNTHRIFTCLILVGLIFTALIFTGRLLVGLIFTGRLLGLFSRARLGFRSVSSKRAFGIRFFPVA